MARKPMTPRDQARLTWVIAALLIVALFGLIGAILWPPMLLAALIALVMVTGLALYGLTHL